MGTVNQFKGAARRKSWIAEMARFEADLIRVVPALGVGEAAAWLVWERYIGREVYIGDSRKRPFLVDLAVCVGIAAMERGHGAAEALEMGRAAADQIRALYKGAWINFPGQIVNVVRDAWVYCVLRGDNADAICALTGMTHRHLRRVARLGRSLAVQRPA